MPEAVYSKLKADATIMFMVFCIFKFRKACLLQLDAVSFCL